MKALYSNGETFIVRITEDQYYYGDGENTNAFGNNAVMFLRFNPYMEDVSEKDVTIPKKIKEQIEKKGR